MGGLKMLRFSRWTKNEQEEFYTMNVEFREMDFYGPFLLLELKRRFKTKEIKVRPIEKKIETPQISENDFSLISKASKELFEQIKAFKLCLKNFEVVIDSSNTEELILEKLKEQPLL